MVVEASERNYPFEMKPKKNLNPFAPAKEVLPPYDKIPAQFKDMNNQSKWNQLFTDWFYCGLEELKVIPKAGIDQNDALHHISIAMRGFDSAHEHKTAGVAYLMSEFFEDATWKKKEKD